MVYATSFISGSLQLSSIGVENVEENRQALRQMLFTAPDIEKYISGVVSKDPVPMPVHYLHAHNGEV